MSATNANLLNASAEPPKLCLPVAGLEIVHIQRRR
jgi:hypothetical protein